MSEVIRKGSEAPVKAKVVALLFSFSEVDLLPWKIFLDARDKKFPIFFLWLQSNFRGLFNGSDAIRLGFEWAWTSLIGVHGESNWFRVAVAVFFYWVSPVLSLLADRWPSMHRQVGRSVTSRETASGVAPPPRATYPFFPVNCEFFFQRFYRLFHEIELAAALKVPVGTVRGPLFPCLRIALDSIAANSRVHYVSMKTNR